MVMSIVSQWFGLSVEHTDDPDSRADASSSSSTSAALPPPTPVVAPSSTGAGNGRPRPLSIAPPSTDHRSPKKALDEYETDVHVKHTIASSNNNTTSTAAADDDAQQYHHQHGVPTTRPLHKTKSDELLRDFEAMRFLADVDSRLKVLCAPLPTETIDRLEALYAQAMADGCQPLMDIVEHFETVASRLHRCAGSSTLPPHTHPHAHAPIGSHYYVQ